MPAIMGAQDISPAYWDMSTAAGLLLHCSADSGRTKSCVEQVWNAVFLVHIPLHGKYACLRWKAAQKLIHQVNLETQP